MGDTLLPEAGLDRAALIHAKAQLHLELPGQGPCAAEHD
jgi:hypothetical protein